MGKRSRFRLWAYGSGKCARGLFFLTPLGMPLAMAAEEIAPFRMTSFDGYATTRYVSDQQTSVQSLSATPGAAGRSTSSQGSSGFRTDVFVNGHGYVFHPNFLSLDIGGGPVVDMQRMSTDSYGQTSASATLFNLSTRASLLRGKPISGNIYFDHLNPTLTVAPGEVIAQENTRFGFDAGVTSALSPLPVRVAYASTHVAGQGATRKLDDTVEQFSLNTSRSFGALGSTQMQYQQSRQASYSGNLALPIQASTSETQGLNFDTRLQFGSERQHDFTQLFSSNNRQYTVGGNGLPKQSDMNVLFDLRSRPARQLGTYGTLQYLTSEQGVVNSRTQVMAGGLNWTPGNAWEAGLGLRGERNKSTDFEVSTRSLDSHLKYRQEILSGIFQSGYSLHYEQRDQLASAASSSVVSESLDIAITPLALARQHILISSIRVLNPTRTQVYVEGIDYRVTVLGYETRLERTIGTSIPLGEQVLVDYSYDTGGSYSLNQLDQNFNASWGVSRFFNVFYRRYDASPRLSGGTASFQLNEVQSDIFGARGEWPFRFLVPMTVGGSFEREDRMETIAPFRRESQDIFLQTDESFFGMGNYRLSARKLRVKYQSFGQDVDITGYDFRSWNRRWFNVDVSMVTSYERDDGGLIPRKRMDNSLNAQWRERKLSINLNYVASKESQGDFRRDRQMLNLLLRRDF